MTTPCWLILGATSSMARAFARLQAENGAQLLLAGRDAEDLRQTAADCTARGAAAASTVPFDARQPEGFDEILQALSDTEGQINVAVFVGSMPDQAEIDANPALLDGMITDNFTGPARLLHKIAPLIEAQGSGTIVGVSSVAGDRGRLGNYAYGAAKAGFTTYLSGLRNRLNRSGGHVVTVKPGFVDTAMTWGIEGMFLVATPRDLALALDRAVRKRTNVLYTPFFWRYIMMIIRAVPEPIFKKLSI